MGAIKSKKSRGSKVAKGLKKVSGMLKGKSGGKRRSRVTPEKLAKKILIEKLKKKLYKMKYGGR